MLLANRVICIAYFVSKANKQKELVQELQKLVITTRQEPNCLRYELFNNVEHDNHWLVYEEYQDALAYQQHAQSTYLQAFKVLLPALTESFTLSVFDDDKMHPSL